MKVDLFNRLRCSLLLLSFILVNCGGSSSSTGDKKGDDSKHLQKGTSGSYSYDLTAMSKLNSSYSEDFGGEPTWDVRVAVNGEEKNNFKDAKLSDLKNSLSSLEFKHYDIVTTEMTVKDQKGRVLATNMSAVAAKDPELKKLWDAECSTGVSSEYKIEQAGYEYVDGGNRLVMKLSICDFAGFSLKGVIRIAPQKKLLEKKLVIYHCEMTPRNTSIYGRPSVNLNTETKCSYGYQTLPGEAPPKIEVLKDYAPGTPLYMEKLLKTRSIELETESDHRIKLKAEFSIPPFGSIESCHTTKVDVKFATESGVQSKRLEFKRNPNEGIKWVPQNYEDWPTMLAVARYYKNSANEKIHIYSFCDWIPEGRDVNGGNIISIDTN